jgi:predicted nucleic acid-binding protein
MFTVDASVHINAMNSAEDGFMGSAAFLQRLREQSWPVFSPALLLVEVAAATARANADLRQVFAITRALGNLPGQTWVALDESLAIEAARLAAEVRLRGADAVYAAVATRHRCVLVTRDRQQLERLPQKLTVLTPEEAMTRFDEAAPSCD